MMDFSRIWNELEADICIKDKAYLSKKINKGNPGIFLGIDKDLDKALLIRLENIVDINQFPKIKGVSIKIETLTIFKEKNYYLVVSNSQKDLQDVFKYFIYTLMYNIVEINNMDQMINRIKIVLVRWRTFFEKEKQIGLSKEQQRGLYGELWMLKILCSEVGVTKAFDAWTGYNKTSHDFQLDKVTLEIKTTSTKKNHKVIISNEKQLDNYGMDTLMLGVLIVNESQNVGQTLNEIVNDLLDILKNHGLDIEFINRLTEIGYLQINCDIYITKYIDKGLKLYKVEDGFPRVIGSDLMDGIGDLKYSISLGSCKNFEINISELKNYL